MRFIEDHKCYVPAHVDVAVTESVKHNLRGGYNDTMRVKHFLPQACILPLVGFERARYQTDGYGKRPFDNIVLLFAKRNGWGEEPADLGVKFGCCSRVR